LELGELAIPFATALGVAALTTPIVSRVACALHVVDRPNERKVNRRPNVPLMGGLAVALGFFVGSAVAVLMQGDDFDAPHRVKGFLVGGAMLLALGAFDDRWSLRAGPKFAVQGMAAAIAIFYGFEIDHISDPFAHSIVWLPGPIAWLATVGWIVGVTNAINLIDGLDGLATGVGVIIATTLSIVCWQAGEMTGVLLGVTFVGALLGFLPFNFSPARIFLGDTGALFIGFVLSLLALEGYRKVSVLTFVVPLLALAVPIMDTLLSVIRRLRRQTNPFAADRAHMHHRLLESEGSQRSAVLSLYFLTTCFCVIAVAFTKLGGLAALLFLVAVIALTVRMLRNLGFFGVDTADGTEPAVGREGGDR
jgi:UDP-GlcNAc:undecaprenyl-phosphate GlcNAc-1-phosphate transferase